MTQYPIVEKKEYTEDGETTKAIRYALTMSSDLLYFDGHFDQAAILPGVVQLHWAVHFGKEDLGVTGEFEGNMEAVKFQQVIRAEQTVTLELKYDKAKNKLHFKYFSGDVAHSSGRILMMPNDNG